ncbi:hypothetical protein [Chromohalobacter sp. 296-RDG]|uniref:hypothetical protein n=1 Tax=Chromohalobacter sp. 296-RDG TaxID=2994062 RepID=UPI0024697EDC|nr:hypothetical protein [Chromohalobacter sp. 296-RDG]
MTDTKTVLLCLVGVIALGVGGGLPVWLIDVEVHGSLLRRSQNVMGLGALFFTSFAFIQLGKKHPQLRCWATETLLGVGCMLFAGGFLVSSISNLYMLLPLPGWLHLTASLVFGLVAAVFLFTEFMRSR